MEELRKTTEYKNLVVRRAASKRAITNTLKQTQFENADVLPCIDVIESCISQVESFDVSINELIFKITDLEFEKEAGKELDAQSEYLLYVKTEISKLKRSIDVKPNISEAEKPVSSSNYKMKLPEIQCETFSGEGTSNLQFHSFLTSFENVIGNQAKLSDSIKLTYLKSYLRGYASKIVQQLQICDENYAVALSLLSEEFFNKDAFLNSLKKPKCVKTLKLFATKK